MAPIRTTSDMDIDFSLPSDISDFNPSDYIQTAHNSRLYKENQNLKRMVRELVDYQTAHPKLIKPTTREEIDNEKKVALAIEIKKKYIRAQMAVMKTLYRQSVMKVREEKEQTAKSRSHNDGLILGLNNLKYEEQSLRSEISAAENHDHKYKKLPLIPVETFLAEFPEHSSAAEHDLMTVRIEHEHQVRVKLEERRQEKLKQKQKLIAEVKKGKDDLTKLDGMVEKFIEAAEPISKALAITEKTEGSAEPVRKTLKLAEYIARTTSSADAIKAVINATAHPPKPITAAPPNAAIMTLTPPRSAVTTPVAPAPSIIAAVASTQVTLTPTASARNILIPIQPAPPIITTPPPPTPKKKNLTLQERMDAEVVIAKQLITPGEPAQAVSRILVDRFGPIFSRVVEHFAPDEKNKASVYMSLAVQFSRDMEAFIQEKFGR